MYKAAYRIRTLACIAGAFSILSIPACSKNKGEGRPPRPESTSAQQGSQAQGQEPEKEFQQPKKSYKDLFEPYLIYARQQGDQSKKSWNKLDRQGRVLYEQYFRTYPKHTNFQFKHELVERQEDPEKVMEIMNLQEGMSVADIGCGSGFFTTAFAKAVGRTGTVYALDIQESALEYLQNRVKEDPSLDPYNNIVFKVSKVDDTTLPPNTLDAGLLSHADFYMFQNLLDENIKMIDSLYRSFKPGGQLTVIQFLGIGLNTAGKFIKTNFEAAGFHTKSYEYDPELTVWYGAFVKPEEPAR